MVSVCLRDLRAPDARTERVSCEADMVWMGAGGVVAMKLLTAEFCIVSRDMALFATFIYQQTL